MKQADVVVIGGSAAGIAASITARRHYPDKSILLVRGEKQVLIPCGIPYIFGTVGSPEKNLIPDAVLEKNKVELLVDEVTEIDRNDRKLATAGGEEIGYDKLIISTGSSPVLPPIPGADKKNVFTIKKDVSYLQELLDALKDASDLVIIGGGFIGVEFADECKKNRDLTVTIVEMLSHCLLLAHDENYCVEAQQLLNDRGVETLVSEKVAAITGDGKVERVKLQNGQDLKADVVIVAVGVAPNVELAGNAGLELGATGGIAVDRAMRTSDENIFACGDCAEKLSFFTGKPIGMKLASIATTEARIAGANLFATRRENPGVLGVYSTVIGECAFAAAGLTEKTAKENGFDVVCGVAEGPNRHPGGMPRAANLKLKLVFEKTRGVLLGGQVSGADSAGELLNVIGACVLRKMTADEIATFQAGTHPALTASPIAYQLVNAAEMAIGAMRN